MKLDCILTAVNDNPLYLDFIPIFLKTWNKLYPTVDIKIVFIAKIIPEHLLQYKHNIILFEPIENVLTSFTSQFIRLLYPCLLHYKNGVMITDMDILPMNNTYYTKHIELFDSNRFIYLRENVCFEKNEIAMCYNVATPNVWREIFEINTIDDIRRRIKQVSHMNIIKEGQSNNGWNIDQKLLYQHIMKWHKKTNRFICLKESDTKFKRLNRNTFRLTNDIKQSITNGEYSDYHCYRPMSQYKSLNDEIYNLLIG